MAQALRKATPADAQELATLHVECWKETYMDMLPEGFFDSNHSDQRLAMWTRILSDSNPKFSLALAHNELGALVGFAFAAPNVGDAEGLPEQVELQLYNLYVLREFHGDGTGQALLDEVLGKESALLWVAEQNPRAIKFYERNGFVFDGVSEQDPMAPKIVDLRMVR